MQFNLFILGCQYNYYDAKRIAHLLQKMGYVYVRDEKKADVIIVLACSVRQKAMDRIWGKIKVWRAFPKQPKIIITACLLPRDKIKLINHIDAIIDSKNIESELLKHIKKLKIENLKLKIDSPICFFPKGESQHTAYIPIMQGCDNFCSYCAVPYTRGREISRPMDEIIAEAKEEIKSGKKHIILLGQNVNSYERGLKRKKNISADQHGIKNQREPAFVRLLKKIDLLKGNFDYNFMSSNPHDFSDELINTLAELEKWTHELHLPLQSGNDEILSRMNRKYTHNQYLSLISKLKAQISNLKISSDIIVGFPGETRKQFTDTVSLCKKIGFNKAYVAQYSPRPGTPAAKLKDDVSTTEKKRRWLILNNIINKN